ncbi:hypothetical protein [Hydrogenophaga sp. NH-16]|uniref:hypothetical protein n=1 Tax=Hydrogenophaga sp. NH-16 TaxID=2184519 RepID=UPI000FDA1568|nr:hypothetical protein [Hydrogenophaga sp. NH-16]
MNPKSQTIGYLSLKILLMSCLVVSLSFAWQGHKGFSLWDEGFLWYGVQRVSLGEVPIRDFMAYDPGRYYWSAAFLAVTGDNGIMGVRAAVAVFQVLGLFTGMWLVVRSGNRERKDRLFFWAVSAVILVLWMFPRHKLFDISLSIMLMGVLTGLVGRPTLQNHLIAGVCLGVVAVFGRNHGVYGAVAGLGVIVWLSLNRSMETPFLKRLALWVVGILIGYLPIVFMALLVPDFAGAFWSSVRLLFEQKATNLPLPVPWPWTVTFSTVSAGEAVRGVLTGLFFMGVLALGGMSVVWVVYRQLKGLQVAPALVASAFLALPYAHYAFSRADPGHLAQGIFPLLIGSLVMLSTARAWVQWPIALTLCAASWGVAHPSHPGWQCLEPAACVDIDIAGDTLQIDPGTANEVAMLRQLSEQFAPDGQPFLVVPFWPGAYALLERPSPMWEIYALFPRSADFEKKEIERIRKSNPRFAVVVDTPLDGRQDLRFQKTHPLIYEYILSNFESMPRVGNPICQVYRAKGAGK